MPSGPYSDAALVLAGHGSTKNSASMTPVYRHAAEIRRRGLFAEVIEGFWMVEPRLTGVWDRVSRRRVFVVPVCISEGYFTTEVIPKALGLVHDPRPGLPRMQSEGGRHVHYCAPIGTHPSMTEALLERARTVGAAVPGSGVPSPGETALFIAGHGTDRHEGSREAILRQVGFIRARGLYAEVHPAFLEEAPFIRDWHTATPAAHVVMVPFFISDGLHTIEDIPVLLGEKPSVVQDRLRSGRPSWVNPTRLRGRKVWYSASIGTEPHIVDVILQRVQEAAA